MDGGHDTDGSEKEENSCSETEINIVPSENCASILLSNARSLLPKMGALVDAFDSLDLDIACITETWFKPGVDLSAKLDDIEGEHGIKFIHKSRDGRHRRAVGSVAIAFRIGRCNLRRRDLGNRKADQEILCVTGKVGKIQRKIAVFVIYVPPDTRAAKFWELCDTLVAEIAAIKAALGDPIIYVTGDFNHKDVGPCLDHRVASSSSKPHQPEATTL